MDNDVQEPPPALPCSYSCRTYKRLVFVLGVAGMREEGEHIYGISFPRGRRREEKKVIQPLRQPSLLREGASMPPASEKNV